MDAFNGMGDNASNFVVLHQDGTQSYYGGYLQPVVTTTTMPTYSHFDVAPQPPASTSAWVSMQLQQVNNVSYQYLNNPTSSGLQWYPPQVSRYCAPREGYFQTIGNGMPQQITQFQQNLLQMPEMNPVPLTMPSRFGAIGTKVPFNLNLPSNRSQSTSSFNGASKFNKNVQSQSNFREPPPETRFKKLSNSNNASNSTFQFQKTKLGDICNPSVLLSAGDSVMIKDVNPECMDLSSLHENFWTRKTSMEFEEIKEMEIVCDENYSGVLLVPRKENQPPILESASVKQQPETVLFKRPLPIRSKPIVEDKEDKIVTRLLSTVEDSSGYDREHLKELVKLGPIELTGNGGIRICRRNNPVKKIQKDQEISIGSVVYFSIDLSAETPKPFLPSLKWPICETPVLNDEAIQLTKNYEQFQEFFNQSIHKTCFDVSPTKPKSELVHKHEEFHGDYCESESESWETISVSTCRSSRSEDEKQNDRNRSEAKDFPLDQKGQMKMEAEWKMNGSDKLIDWNALPNDWSVDYLSQFDPDFQDNNPWKECVGVQWSQNKEDVHFGSNHSENLASNKMQDVEEYEYLQQVGGYEDASSALDNSWSSFEHDPEFYTENEDSQLWKSFRRRCKDPTLNVKSESIDHLLEYQIVGEWEDWLDEDYVPDDWTPENWYVSDLWWQDWEPVNPYEPFDQTLEVDDKDQIEYIEKVILNEDEILDDTEMPQIKDFNISCNLSGSCLSLSSISSDENFEDIDSDKDRDNVMDKARAKGTSSGFCENCDNPDQKQTNINTLFVPEDKRLLENLKTKQRGGMLRDYMLVHLETQSD